jgi:hypothetical protein
MAAMDPRLESYAARAFGVALVDDLHGGGTQGDGTENYSAQQARSLPQIHRPPAFSWPSPTRMRVMTLLKG